MFIERTDLEGKIQEFILNTASRKSLLIIKGVYGVGKSTFIEQFEKNKLSNNLRLFLDFSDLQKDGYILLKKNVDKLIDDSNVSFKKKSIDKCDFIKSLIKSATINTSFSYDGETDIDTKAGVSVIGLVKNVITLMYENYSSSIKNADSEQFPIVLSRIVKEICQLKNSRLFLIMDEVEKMDFNSSVFIRELLKSEIEMSLFCSTEIDPGNMGNNYFSQTVFHSMLKNDNINPFSKLSLAPFSEAQTAEYFNLRYHRDMTKDDSLIKHIHKLSAGLPLIINVISCSFQDLDPTSFNITEIGNLELLYNRIVANISNSQKEILWYLSLGDGTIDDDALMNVMQNSNKNNYYTDIENLQKNNLIIFNDELGLFQIKYFLISDYINTSDLITNYQKKQYYSKLLNAYRNLPLKESNLEKIVFLNRKLKLYDDAYNNAVKYGRLLLNNHKPDSAIDLIEDILKNITEGYWQQIGTLKAILIEAYYQVKNIEKCIEVFKELSKDEMDWLKTERLYAFISLIIAKAYYYKNDYHNAICYSQKAVMCNDRNIYHASQLLISSAYDLSGQYVESANAYYLGKDKAISDDDYYAQGLYKVACQMISTKYNECINELNEAIHIFENVNYDARNLACSYNNLGIEQMMGGDFESAVQNLKESLKIFENIFSIETHFPQNNLGLYHYLSGNIEKSKYYLLKALDNAISPLQHAYINSNLGVLFIDDRERAMNYFKVAQQYMMQCPDPIVSLKINYNLAHYNLLDNNYRQTKKYVEWGLSNKGINHPQYVWLKEKFKTLSNIENKAYMVPTKTVTNQAINVSRRTMFCSSDWELGELMFYN